MIGSRSSYATLRRRRHLGSFKLTTALTKQGPFAMAKALTLTAIQAQTDIVQAMTQVFDRPTPYTLKSTYVIPATKDRLESLVQLKDSAAKERQRSSSSIPKSSTENVTRSAARKLCNGWALSRPARSSCQAQG